MSTADYQVPGTGAAELGGPQTCTSPAVPGEGKESPAGRERRGKWNKFKHINKLNEQIERRGGGGAHPPDCSWCCSSSLFTSSFTLDLTVCKGSYKLIAFTAAFEITVRISNVMLQNNLSPKYHHYNISTVLQLWHCCCCSPMSKSLLQNPPSLHVFVLPPADPHALLLRHREAAQCLHRMSASAPLPWGHLPRKKGEKPSRHQQDPLPPASPWPRSDEEAPPANLAHAHQDWEKICRKNSRRI